MDELHQRGQALENLFFKEKDAKLLEELRAGMAVQENRAALESATGIHHAATLDALIGLGISAESLTSVGLIPLVAVAWSDGVIQDKERTAILEAAENSGLSTSSPGYQLLEQWLRVKPTDDLLDTWKSYIGELKTTLDESSFSQLKKSVLGRAKKVAEAAGGFLGMGSKVSDSEDEVLSELEAAFR